MKTSVLDDLKSIASRHRELHPNSVADPKATSMSLPIKDDWCRKFKEPRIPFKTANKIPDLIIVYKDKRYAHDGNGWFELEDD